MVSAVGSAVAEMLSGLYLSGAPEDGLINVVCIEMSRFYGLRTQGSAVSCDAKACDLQAGAEGMLTGWRARSRAPTSCSRSGSWTAPRRRASRRRYWMPTP